MKQFQLKRISRCLSGAMIGCFLFGAALADQKALAEDFLVRVENVSTPHTLHTSLGDKGVAISPGVWVLHSGSNPIYTVGQKASLGLKRLAEDGDPNALFSDLQVHPGVKGVGAFDYAALPYPVTGAIGPKQAYEFIVSGAKPGDKLSFATMFSESNDWFYSDNAQGISLFNADGTPMSGEVTAEVGLWDAGTEQNEEPGLGPNQAPRQGRPDTGKSRNDPVSAVTSPQAPSVTSSLKVTITPRP